MTSSKKMRKTLTGVLLLLLCFGTVFGGLVICPKCGYENPADGRTCTHCRAEMPESAGTGEADEKAAVLEQAGTGGVWFLEGEVVDREVALADRYRKSGQLSVARLIYRNAAALDMLADPAGGNTRSAGIVESLRKCEALAKSFRRECPVCGGSGKASMLSQDFAGDVTYREVSGRACGNCYGTGSVMGIGTVAERTAELGRANKEYVMLQRGRKFVPVGCAWVPMSLEGRLSPRQKALLMRTVAAPCGKCIGLGRVDCGKCRGTGMAPCRARGCVKGMVESEMRGGLMKGVRRRAKCKTCNGTGSVACEACRGQGNVLCSECNGRGERAPCAKCNGQGTETCRRCKGAGDVKGEVCAECRGCGQVLCGSCNGDGREE